MYVMNFGTRTQNAIRNMTFGFLNKIFSLLLPFAIRTIIIYRLGYDYIGLGTLFTSILQVLSVAELGFSSAIVFCLYKPVADDDRKEIIEWLQLFKCIYYAVGVVVLILGLAVLPFLPKLIEGDIPADVNLYILYLVYLSNSVISYFVYSYKGVVLIVNQRRDMISNIELFIGIIRSVVQIIVLLVTRNYYAYIVFIPVFTLCTNLVINQITNRFYPQFKVKGFFLNKEKLYSISDQIKGLAIFRLSLVARNSFDSIILSALFGLTITTIYSNYYFIFASVGEFLAVILTSMSAGVGNSLVTESVEKNYEDHNRFDFYFMWIVGWCSICLLCLYQHFMKIWVGTGLMTSFWSMSMFCIYFYTIRMGEVRDLYSEAAGLWWKFRFVTIIEMLSNLGLNFALGILFGMNGILFATIFTTFVFSFISISRIAFREYFKRSVKEYFLNNLLYLVFTLLIAILTYCLCESVIHEGIKGLIVKLFICIFIPNLIYLLLYFMLPKYRKYIKQILNKLLRL